MRDFFEKIYHDNGLRISNRRSLFKDVKQYILNKSLVHKEKKMLNSFIGRAPDLIFIVGVPRSGSTLLHQLLAEHLDIAYISNALSKYWMAPNYAKQFLLDNQSKSSISESRFSSSYGRTSGENSPSEFGYFWQYWLNHKDHDQLSENDLTTIDWPNLSKTLNYLAHNFGSPLLLKNLNYINFKISSIYEKLDAKFIHITRNPADVCSSIYNARIREYGSDINWWSIRPKSKKELSELSAWEQIFHQYLICEYEIYSQLEKLPPEKKLTLDYSQIIEDPEASLISISKKFSIKSQIQSNILKKQIVSKSSKGWMNNSLEQKFEQLRRKYESSYHTT